MYCSHDVTLLLFLQVGHFQVKSLHRYELCQNAWHDCCLPNYVDYTTLIECSNHLYACSREAIEEYVPETNIWEMVSSAKMGPYQFAVSDENCLYFYNLVEGLSMVMRVDRHFEVKRQEIHTPTRYVADVLGVTKLPHHEVLISLRNLTGMSRKIFNMKTNMWKDFNLYHGLAHIQPKAGVQYPQCLDIADLWKMLCDRNCNTIYVLGTKSGMSDIPGNGKQNRNEIRGLDGVLPFYQVNLEGQVWKRLAVLPESLNVTSIKLCISDGLSSMATCSFP